MALLFFFLCLLKSPNLFGQVLLDKEIKQTIDNSIRDLNEELRKANARADEQGGTVAMPDGKIEMQIDQSILDTVCIDCPKLANLSSQVNSALNKLVNTTSLRESNLPLELQNLEAMIYVVRDSNKKAQSVQCSINHDQNFSEMISENVLESKLAVLVLSKEIDKGAISSVQIHKPHQQKVFYYRGKKPNDDKIVRVMVFNGKKAKVDYFVLTKDSTQAQDIKAKIARARELKKADCISKGGNQNAVLVGQIDVSSDDCKSKVSMQAGLSLSSSKDSSGADQIGEIKLVDVQARIIEGAVGVNVGGVVTNRGTTARIGVGDQNKELIYTRLSDINGGEVAGGIPYQVSIPGDAGATISGEFGARKSLLTGSESEQVSIRIQPNSIGTSISATAQANQQVTKKKIINSENYSIELNQPIGPGNLCFRYSFQKMNDMLMNPTYWACYRVRF